MRRITGSSIVTCISGAIGGRSGKFIYKTMSSFRIYARRTKGTGGGIVNGPAWKQTQATMKFLDVLWNNQTNATRALWTHEAAATASHARSGMDWYRHVNLNRAYLRYPPITSPPDRTRCEKRIVDNSMPEFADLPDGKYLPVWMSGWTLGAPFHFTPNLGQAELPDPCEEPPPAEHTIYSATNNGGTIDPAGETTVPHGQNQAYDMAPGDNAEGCQLRIDGEYIGYQADYEFENVVEDHWITAFYRPLEILLTLSGYTARRCFGSWCDDLNWANIPLTWRAPGGPYEGMHPRLDTIFMFPAAGPPPYWDLWMGNPIGVPIACFEAPAIDGLCAPPKTGWIPQDCCCDTAGTPVATFDYW